MRSVRPFPQHIILVYGCAIEADGTPSLRLQWRLAVAAQRYHELVAANPPDPATGAARVLMFTSGGAVKNEWAEGAVMREWLIAHCGVPPSAITPETKAVDTITNNERVLELIHAEWPDRGKTAPLPEVYLVTSEFHITRARALAMRSFGHQNRLPFAALHDLPAQDGLEGTALEQRTRWEVKCIAEQMEELTVLLA
jgi:hypothetical protein